MRTRDAHLMPSDRIDQSGIEIETVPPVVDDVNSVYEYPIGGEESTR